MNEYMTNGYVQDDMYVPIPCKNRYELLETNDMHADYTMSHKFPGRQENL